jgi:excisionase family DNA binding protein
LILIDTSLSRCSGRARRRLALYRATTMLTVSEAAERTGRNPETIRRWIREGKLRASKVGTQHVIEERDLQAIEPSEMLPVPAEWGWERTFSGEPMPNVAAWLRRSRTRACTGRHGTSPTSSAGRRPTMPST